MRNQVCTSLKGNPDVVRQMSLNSGKQIRIGSAKAKTVVPSARHQSLGKSRKYTQCARCLEGVKQRLTNEFLLFGGQCHVYFLISF